MKIIRYEVKNGREYALIRNDYGFPKYQHVITEEGDERKVLARFPISAPTDQIACEYASDYVKADN